MMPETSQLKEPVGGAAEATPANRYLRRESISLGLVFCVVFALAGRVTPVFLDVYRGLLMPQGWRLSLLDFMHLGVTLPIALIVLTLLVWKDRLLAPAAAGWLNIAAFATLVLVGLSYLYAMFWSPFPHLT